MNQTPTQAPTQASNMSDNEPTANADSKDAFFQQLEYLAETMIAAHGKEFAMGAMVLTARFIAEGDALAKAAAEAAAAGQSKQVLA